MKRGSLFILVFLVYPSTRRNNRHGEKFVMIMYDCHVKCYKIFLKAFTMTKIFSTKIKVHTLKSNKIMGSCSSYCNPALNSGIAFL